MNEQEQKDDACEKTFSKVHDFKEVGNDSTFVCVNCLQSRRFFRTADGFGVELKR